MHTPKGTHSKTPFLSCTVICVILDHKSKSESSQRNAPLDSRINLIAYAFSRVQVDVYLKQHSVSCVWPLPEFITLVFKAYF